MKLALIYKCGDMASSCDTCLQLPEEYNCGWCKTSSTCEITDQCLRDKNDGWLNRSKTCNSTIWYFSNRSKCDLLAKIEKWLQNSVVNLTKQQNAVVKYHKYKKTRFVSFGFHFLIKQLFRSKNRFCVEI